MWRFSSHWLRFNTPEPVAASRGSMRRHLPRPTEALPPLPPLGRKKSTIFCKYLGIYPLRNAFCPLNAPHKNVWCWHYIELMCFSVFSVFVCFNIFLLRYNCQTKTDLLNINITNYNYSVNDIIINSGEMLQSNALEAYFSTAIALKWS